MNHPEIRAQSEQISSGTSPLESPKLVLEGFRTRIEQLKPEKPENFLKKLHSISKELVVALTQFGQRAYHQFLEKNEGYEVWWFGYEWPETGKRLSLLFRNALFELSRDVLLVRDGKYKSSDLISVSLEIKKTLASVLTECIESQCAPPVNEPPTQRDLKLEAWKHQTHPWPAYQEQLKLIEKQLDDIHRNYQYLYAVQEACIAIERHVEENVLKNIELIGKIQEAAETVKKRLEVQHVGREDGATTSADLLAPISGPDAEHPNLVRVLRQVERILGNFPDDIPFVIVGVSGGMLITREINPVKKIKRWLEFQIFPVLYEVWELTEGLLLRYKLVKGQLQHRLSSIEPGQSLEVLSNTLERFIDKTKSVKTQLRSLEKITAERFEANFKIGIIFENEEEFLPIPLQFTIGQIGSKNIPLVSSAIRIWKDRTRPWRRRLRKLQALQHISIPERISAFVKARTVKVDECHYTSIFHTKGFVGDLFISGREQELKRAEKLIADWRNGFRGAILLTGPSLCGKSLLGQLIANRFFQEKTIALRPHTKLEVQGRTVACTCNLGETLEHLLSRMEVDQHMIWIDDLECWHDHDQPLISNLHVLGHLIDQHSARVFFCVSMGALPFAFANRQLRFSQYFQGIFDLSRLSPEDIQKAIITRHDATHMELTDEQGNPVSLQKIKKLIAAIYDRADGNIGEALNLWAASIVEINQQQVVFRSKLHLTMPDFLDPDVAILLRTIALHKEIGEYELRKIFGPAFTEKYTYLVRRLILLGLLKRNSRDLLELNEFTANSVVNMLHKNKYLINE